MVRIWGPKAMKKWFVKCVKWLKRDTRQPFRRKIWDGLYQRLLVIALSCIVGGAGHLLLGGWHRPGVDLLVIGTGFLIIWLVTVLP